MPKKKNPTKRRSLDSTVDKLIGRNLIQIRTRRGITQLELAEKLGLSFQQIQKYETGANRISASTLYLISDVLAVNIADFFMGLPGQKNAFKISAEEMELLKIYSQLPNTKTQHSVRKIIRTLAREE